LQHVQLQATENLTRLGIDPMILYSRTMTLLHYKYDNTRFVGLEKCAVGKQAL